jgi:NAD(P)-dependent dehydrogenase (short-subunit alcohol dehydrogenase family)
MLKPPLQLGRGARQFHTGAPLQEGRIQDGRTHVGITTRGWARFIAADLSNPADLRQLVEDVGELDVLVNFYGKAPGGASDGD